MGFRSITSLLFIFLIMVILFGTKRLRELGNDLGVAVRSFRRGLKEDDETIAKKSIDE